jgi:hypothetical protein
MQFQIQQLYHILLLTEGTILGAVFGLMTSLTLCIAYCGVRPALIVKISRPANDAIDSTALTVAQPDT